MNTAASKKKSYGLRNRSNVKASKQTSKHDSEATQKGGN